MSVFASLIFFDSQVQTEERTRFFADKSYSPDGSTITSVEIDPGDGGGYIDVTNADSDLWYLDYQYATSGTKTVQVRVQTDSATGTTSGAFSVVSRDEKLYSDDDDLTAFEPDILKWLPKWKANYNFIHRKSKDLIFKWMDRQGFVDVYNDKFTEADVAVSELNEWSTFMSLSLIFYGLSNSPDDTFFKKAQMYEAKEITARNRFVLRLDVNADGTVDEFEQIHLSSGRLFRR